MSQHVALYGFTRRKDGLRVSLRGIDQSRCFLYHIGGDTAAVVSLVDSKEFNSNLTRMVRHDEVVHEIFSKQVILPVKFPKVVSLKSLKKNFQEMDGDIAYVLRKIVYKEEYHVKVFLLDSGTSEMPSLYYNAFSRYILDHATQYRYKHYFPILTQEAKEAEFLHYAEQVVGNMSQSLTRHAAYWRAKSFCSERILLDSVFWIRRHRVPYFKEECQKLRTFYPNLRLSLLGPRPPYNFVKIDLKDEN